jgi:23S rRNA (cytidine1920-2'-O)/16S rRNA (cytidine1409-2'-O)-methyltransferase
VSRAGEKLSSALGSFGIDPSGRHCLDAGSSTGGFTDCLLQFGAASVTAVDVGTHQLHERLRSDRRVDVREQTDIRQLRPETLAHPPSLVVADLSFISLRLVLPALVAFGPVEAVVLIKPQFEAGRDEASRGRGVIGDPEIWRRVIEEVVAEAARLGMPCTDVMVSPVPGRAGNVEFMAHLQVKTTLRPVSSEMIGQVVAAAAGEQRTS